MKASDLANPRLSNRDCNFKNILFHHISCPDLEILLEGDLRQANAKTLRSEAVRPEPVAGAAPPRSRLFISAPKPGIDALPCLHFCDRPGRAHRIALITEMESVRRERRATTGAGRGRLAAMLGAAAAVALALLAVVSSASAQSSTTKAVTVKKSTTTRVTVQNTHRIDLPCKSGTYRFTEGGSLAIFEDQFKEGTTEFLASWNSLGKNVVANKDQSVDLKLLRPATTYEKTGRYQGAGAVITHRRRLPYGTVTAYVRAGPRNVGCFMI